MPTPGFDALSIKFTDNSMADRKWLFALGDNHFFCVMTFTPVPWRFRDG